MIPSLDPLLRDLSSVHTHTLCLLKTHMYFNIILPFKTMSTKLSLPFRNFDENIQCMSDRTGACCMSRSSHPYSFKHIKDNLFGEKIQFTNFLFIANYNFQTHINILDFK